MSGVPPTAPKTPLTVRAKDGPACALSYPLQGYHAEFRVTVII